MALPWTTLQMATQRPGTEEAMATAACPMATVSSRGRRNVHAAVLPESQAAMLISSKGRRRRPMSGPRRRGLGLRRRSLAPLDLAASPLALWCAQCPLLLLCPAWRGVLIQNLVFSLGFFFFVARARLTCRATCPRLLDEEGHWPLQWSFYSFACPAHHPRSGTHARQPIATHRETDGSRQIPAGMEFAIIIRQEAAAERAA